MKIFVKVKTKSRNESLEQISENIYAAKVKEAPEKGRANKAVIRLLSEYFKIRQQKIRTSASSRKPCSSPRLRIKIVSGETSKIKVINIRS